MRDFILTNIREANEAIDVAVHNLNKRGHDKGLAYDNCFLAVHFIDQTRLREAWWSVLSHYYDGEDQTQSRDELIVYAKSMKDITERVLTERCGPGSFAAVPANRIQYEADVRAYQTIVDELNKYDKE